MSSHSELIKKLQQQLYNTNKTNIEMVINLNLLANLKSKDWKNNLEEIKELAKQRKTKAIIEFIDELIKWES